MKRSSRGAGVALLVLALATGMTGCRKNKFIEKVTFRPAENLETVRISLVFTPKVQIDIGGGFAIKEYGYLFINPFTTATPFELGFDLNTSIVNEQDYVHLEPTTVLPNGMPIGVTHPLVEVRSPNPIHNKFDLYGYVDVSEKSWLGVAALFKVLDQKNLPSDLALSQAFFRNSEGIPSVLASVFGPKLDSEGQIERSGGIAIFANVRQLLDGVRPGQTEELSEGPSDP